MKAFITFALLCANLVEGYKYTVRKHDWKSQLKGLKPPSVVKHSEFTQYLDHSNKSLGTFQQHYYYSTEFWNGPGSPVILFTVGEQNATANLAVLGNDTLTGALAEEIGAAVIVFEHRYWGDSSPFDEHTTANLQWLTIEQSMHDHVNFANNVQLPFASHNASSTADVVPWVLMGGSYPGALTAWIANVMPGTFWAYHASSAIVQSIGDFWQYSSPIIEGMPSNCSKDVTLVTDYMDNVFLTGTEQEKYDLKAMFGGQDIKHDDDFMASLLDGWHGDWQTQSFDSPPKIFYKFCDYVENSVNQTNPALLPGTEGVGLDKALEGFVAWYRMHECPTDDCSIGAVPGLGGFDTYNASAAEYNTLTVADDYRPWMWLLCNEMFDFSTAGRPWASDSPTLVSRLLQPDYFIRSCHDFFPPGPNGETFGIAKGATPQNLNSWTGGWNPVNLERIVFTNGEFDPWRETTVSAYSRPGGPLPSSDQIQVNLIPGGSHCPDMSMRDGLVNGMLAAVQQKEIWQLKAFVEQWPSPTDSEASSQNTATESTSTATASATTSSFTTATTTGGATATSPANTAKMGSYIMSGIS